MVLQGHYNLGSDVRTNTHTCHTWHVAQRHRTSAAHGTLCTQAGIGLPRRVEGIVHVSGLVAARLCVHVHDLQHRGQQNETRMSGLGERQSGEATRGGAHQRQCSGWPGCVPVPVRVPASARIVPGPGMWPVTKSAVIARVTDGGGGGPYCLPVGDFPKNQRRRSPLHRS